MKRTVPIIRSSGPIDRIISVTKAVVQHLGSELPLLNLEEKEERMKICKECEFFNNNWCKHCGCNMNLKTLLPLQECPIKKWGVHLDAQKIIDQHSKNTDVKIGECQNCPKKEV